MAERITDNIAGQIERSKRRVTVLFTDIVGSTRFWEEHGDTVGRLMVDRHNRLLFPIVRAYGGRVLKTIGDSIMASFRKPHKALLAAIAMQQAVAAEEALGIEVRIGMHTGEALVEHGDVFGDAVNVAARVEGMADGGQVLVSQATLNGLGRRRPRFRLKRHKTFVPKGKSRELTVYAANWQAHRRLVPRQPGRRLEPLGPAQKLWVLAYLAVAVALVSVLYDQVLRYLLADFEPVAIALLGSSRVVMVAAFVLALGAAVWLLKRARPASIRALRILKGVFGFGLVFMLAFFADHHFQPDLGRWWAKPLLRSDHLFVQVLEDGAGVYPTPKAEGDPLLRADSGDLFLQTQKLRRGAVTWTKVLIDLPEHRYGYLPRRLPPRAGFPARQVTRSSTFRFRVADLILFGLGALGFGWGFLTFRIRPI